MIPLPRVGGLLPPIRIPSIPGEPIVSIDLPFVSGRVQVNIAARGAEAVWRPAVILRTLGELAVNVQVFLDAAGDHEALCGFLAQAYAPNPLPDYEVEAAAERCRLGLIHGSAIHHESVLAEHEDHAGMVWRWPPA